MAHADFDTGGDQAKLSKELLETFHSEEERRRKSSKSAKKRKVLVVGGSGYVGVPVISFLLEQGYVVRNLDCAVYENAGSCVNLLGHGTYEHIHGDMADPDVRSAALADIDDVVILAGLVGDPITKAFPWQSQLINDDAVTSFLDSLNGLGLNKVVFVSTCSNYGLIEDGQLADEAFELKPLSLYAKSKVAAEEKILSSAGKVDYYPTVLRFATAFGLAPRMRFDLTVNEFARDLSIGKVLEVYDAHTWRPYCHIKDFALLIDRVLRFPVDTVAFEVFNAGGDKNNYTKQGIVDLIKARLPNSIIQYKSDSSDPRNYKVNFAKVRDQLHFEPRYTVDDGIVEVINAVQAKAFDDYDARKGFYGNYTLPGLDAMPRYCASEQAAFFGAAQ